MRLIDADKLIETLVCERDERFHFALDALSAKDRSRIMSVLRCVIAETPTASCTEKVIRCKECKFGHRPYTVKSSTGDEPTECFCGIDDMFHDKDWFCPDARPKEGERYDT